MKQRILIIAALAALFLLSACGRQINGVMDGMGEVAKVSQPIFNGSPPDQPYHGAVVSLHQVASGSVYVSPFCSGTLITPTVVVTAGHCLDVVKGKKVGTLAPSKVAVYVGNEPAVDILDHLYMVSETKLNPTYNPFQLLNDIALIRLATPVTEVAPVAYLPASLGFTSSDIGQTVNFAGFGRTETGSIGVKLQVNVPLGGLGCTVEGCPDSGDSSTMISYLQPGYVGGPCSGDSGGPAFIDRGGVPYLAGVTSYGDAACLVYGVSTRVDAFEGFISSFTNTGPDCSANGVCNPECAEGQDPDCSSSNNCGDGVCQADESCDGRNGTTSCIADCPGKTGGKPKGRYCYVGGTCEGPACP